MDSITNNRLQKAIKTILRLNVNEQSQSGMVSLTTAQTRYTFSQQITQNTQLVLTQFIRNNEPNSSSIQDDQIHQYLAIESKAQFESRKKTQMLRHRFAPLYFIGGFGLSFAIWIMFIENAEFATPTIRKISLFLIIGALFLCWFNRIYYHRVKEKLQNDNLTLADCEYVLSSLFIKRLRTAMLFFVCLLMIFFAFYLPQTKSKNRESNLLQQYNDSKEEAADHLREIENLLEQREYSAALEIASSERSKAYRLSNSLNAGDQSLYEKYSDAMKHVYRCYISGYWIGESSYSASTYTVYFIPESGTDFYVIPFETRPSFYEAEALTADSRYCITGCTEHYSIGAIRSIAYYRGRGNCLLELDCSSLQDETVKIDDRVFYRLTP